MAAVTSLATFFRPAVAGRPAVWVAVWLLAAPGAAPAQELITPVSIISSTAATDYYPAANLINGGGLSATPTAATVATISHAGAGASSTWVTATGGSDWFAVVKPAPVLTLGLAGEMIIQALVVWGYPVVTSPNNNEAKTFVVEFSTDGGATWGGAATLNHARTAQASEVLTFPPRRANTVRISITDNHYGSSGASGGDRVGLGEIRFLGSGEIPTQPVLAVTASWIDFGNHPADPGVVERRLGVRNDGLDQPLALGPVTLAGPNVGQFRIESVPPPIPAGSAGDLVVSYRPGDRLGAALATLRLGSNDPRSPETEVALLGAVGGATMPRPEPPVFSVPSGVFPDDFALDAYSPTPGAIVLFTTDGGEPGVDKSRVWSGPLAINRTTRLRAVAVAAGGGRSDASEAGFTKLSAVLQSRSSPLPILVLDNFGAGPVPDKKWTTNTQTGAGLKQVTRQPVWMSLIDRSPATGRASLLASPSITTRAGLRVRGAFSSTWSPQPYSMESWDADGRDAEMAALGMPPESDWVLYHPHPSYDVTFIFNTYIWELSRRTGRYAPAFRHVEVFVNDDGDDLESSDRRGLYALVEEVKRDPNRLDFDPLSDDGTTGGWLHTINRMDPEPEDGFPAANGALSPQFFRTPGPNRLLQTVANNPTQVADDIPRQYNAFINFEDPGGYQINPTQRAAIEAWFKEFEGVLYDAARWRDPVTGYRKHLNTRDFIDYFQLLNLARQGDGLLLSLFPWVSSGERRLHMGPMWDFNNGAYHLSGAPTGTLYYRQDQLWYPRLFADPDFLMEYVDRWFELRRGPYATASLTGIADALAADITTEIAATHGVSAPAWTGRLNAMKNFLVQRANWIDTQYVRPPALSPDPGPQTGPVAVTAAHHPTATGTLYVTVDGSDPRARGGAPSTAAYTGPITVSASSVVRARTRTASGQWSGLSTTTYLLNPPASAANLVVSEIHFNPAGANDPGEFLELMNVSAATIDLTGVRFDRGIQCAIAAGTTLAAGERAIVAARASDFADRPEVRVIGEFEAASRLDNGGEWLRLVAWDASTIAEFAWDDVAPWPRLPDGGGPSLTLIAPAARPDPGNPRHWRSSTAPGGSPGGSDSRSFFGDPLGDSDLDGIANLCAHGLGLVLAGPGPRLPSLSLENGRLIALVPVDLAAEDVDLTPEWSADLNAWEPLAALLADPMLVEEPDGRTWLRFESGDLETETQGYLRVRVRKR